MSKTPAMFLDKAGKLQKLADQSTLHIESTVLRQLPHFVKYQSV
jgi:hypothetical protein